MRPRRVYPSPARDPRLLSDVPKRCRLCLSLSDALTPISQGDDASPLSLASHIRAALRIEIVNDERLPTKICEPCKLEVERYYKFRRKCEIAEKKLQLHLRFMGLMLGPASLTNITYTNDARQRRSAAEEQLRALVRAALLVGGAVVSPQETVTLPPGQEFPELEVRTLDGSLLTMQICEEDESEELKLPLTVSLPTDPDSTTTCPKCQDTFSDQVLLAEHMVRHSRSHKCFQCSKYFLSASSLQRHSRTHSGERPYACVDCGKCFAQKEVLSRHSLIHLESGERPHRCAKCGKGYAQLGSLAAHERSHAPPGSRPLHLVPCAQCPKAFCHASGLSRHFKSHRGKLECSECRKQYADKSSLRRHIRAVHTRENRTESLQEPHLYT